MSSRSAPRQAAFGDDRERRDPRDRPLDRCTRVERRLGRFGQGALHIRARDQRRPMRGRILRLTDLAFAKFRCESACGPRSAPCVTRLSLLVSAERTARVDVRAMPARPAHFLKNALTGFRHAKRALGSRGRVCRRIEYAAVSPRIPIATAAGASRRRAAESARGRGASSQATITAGGDTTKAAAARSTWSLKAKPRNRAGLVCRHRG